MTETFKAVKVSDSVYWVGAIDWSIRDFHGYSTDRGTTYNAYLVMADKITLIDTVKAPFKEELVSRIASVIEPEEIEYIVSNHSEMDHSGCLREMIGLIRPEKVFASKMGKKALKEHFHIEDEIVAVNDGQSLSLGNMSLTFFETRMLHWPDSMISYLDTDALLFSQDGFGMHLASNQRFADQIPEDVLEYEAGKYYANILLLYSPVVKKLLDRVDKLDVPIRIVAPDHGSIWRREEDIKKVLGWYSRWAEQKPSMKALMVYDTMWQSTAKMARAIAEGLAEGGARVKLIPVRASHRSEVATEILDSGALIVGSPTINNNIFPSLGDVMVYLKGLRPRNKIGAVFGSYGWSGEATRHLKEMLEEMDIEVLGEVKSHYVPDEAVLKECFEMGVKVAERLQGMVKGS